MDSNPIQPVQAREIPCQCFIGRIVNIHYRREQDGIRTHGIDFKSLMVSGTACFVLDGSILHASHLEIRGYEPFVCRIHSSIYILHMAVVCIKIEGSVIIVGIDDGPAFIPLAAVETIDVWNRVITLVSLTFQIDTVANTIG